VKEAPIRARFIILVAAGFLAGAMTAYYILWRTHGLVPGHPLALRASEILSRPARAPRTIPPTATAAPTATVTPAAGE
jgi:hypothetical protein